MAGERPPEDAERIPTGAELTALDPTKAVGSGDPGPQIYNTLVETRGCRYGDPVMAPSLANVTS